jgi:radical SAM protein with 4Fe4S-binding SPASM domain
MKVIRYIGVGLQNIVKPTRAWAGPLHLQVEVTTFCNLDCVMCSHGTLVKKPKHLTLNEFIRICKLLRPYKISMNGIGEPLLNPDMISMVEHAHQQGMTTITTSNMTVISSEMANRIVASGLSLLKGSIDSTDPTTYLAIRRRDMHHKVLEGLRNIRDAKRRAGSKTPYVRLQFVMQRANFRQIPQVLDLCEEFGVDAIFFQPLDLSNDNYVTPEMIADLIGDMDPDEFRNIIELAAKKSVECSVVTNLLVLCRDFDTIWEKYRMVKAPDPETAVCMMPWSSLYISVDGDARLCCAFASSPEGNLGNVFTEEFDAIWNGQNYREYRKEFARGHRPNKACRNCIAPTLPAILKSMKSSKFMINNSAD